MVGVSDERPDPEIVVFGVEDDLWTDTARPPAPAFVAADGRLDEIRQGDDPARRPRPRWSGLARLGRLQARVEQGLRRSRPGQVAAAVAVLVVVAFVAGLLVGRRSSSGTSAAPPTGADLIPLTLGYGFPEPTFRLRFTAPNPNPVPSPTSPAPAGPRVTVAAADVYAMQLQAKPQNQAGQSVQTRDTGAESGPWSIIVRRSDGSLGRHGAVITYPVAAVRSLSTVHIGRIPGSGASGSRTAGNATIGHVDALGGIVWPIDGKFARIRGDLGRSTLAALAARVSIRNQHPAMIAAPAHYRVIAAEPYRAPIVTQSRYTDSLRVDSGPIDGLIYCGVVIRGASFEDGLFAATRSPAAEIGGHPAITSTVGGGSGTIAWEAAPGIVVFVGFSGGLTASAAVPSLLDLARRGRLLGHAQWTATHPVTNRGDNDYS